MSPFDSCKALPKNLKKFLTCSIDLVAAIKVPQYCKETILKGLRVPGKVEVTGESSESAKMLQLGGKSL